KEYIQERKKRCCKKWCNFKISALSETWFSESHLNLQTVCYFVVYFLTIRHTHTHTTTIYIFRIRTSIIIDISSESLGGEDKIVEIDEAKLRKRKYNKRRLVTGQWIFGGFERGSKKLSIEPVSNHYISYLAEFMLKRRFDFREHINGF
ncbi:hypothetical protein ALC57_11781, partial [Trachymyrmex cornetzi]